MFRGCDDFSYNRRSEHAHISRAMPASRLLLLLPFLLLTGCDRVGALLDQQAENGKAVGAACRHSGRALEDCYQRNSRISKADIFAGWKEMNEYMQQKKLDIVPPPVDPVAPPQAADAAPASASAASEAKPATAEH